MQYFLLKLFYSDLFSMLYVLFVLTLRPGMQIADAITTLENNIESYKSENNLELEYSRVLIRQNFRVYLEQNVTGPQN